MEMKNSPAYVFNTHVEAEAAVRELGKSGFDMKKLSLIGKGYHSEEHPVGFYTTGDRIESWGGVGDCCALRDDLLRFGDGVYVFGVAGENVGGCFLVDFLDAA